MHISYTTMSIFRTSDILYCCIFNIYTVYILYIYYFHDILYMHFTYLEYFSSLRCSFKITASRLVQTSRSLGSHCSTDSFISTLSVRRFTATNIEFYTVCWHDFTAASRPSSPLTFDLTSGRLTVLSEPSS